MSKVTPDQEIEALKKEVERLGKALSTAEADRDDVTRKSAAFRNDTDEVPTGKSVKVTKCKGYKNVGYHDDGRPILRPEWHEVDQPSYYYTIDMPPVGGTDIKLNGREFFHGQTYEVTLDELRTLKDIVHRLWGHERDIHEDNEKVYRQHYSQKFSRFFPKGALSATGQRVN